MRAIRDGERAVAVTDLSRRFGALRGGAWPEPTEPALVLPLTRATQSRPDGYLVAGVSPRRALDPDYRAFLGLVANQLGGAVASALAFEETQKLHEMTLGLSAELDLRRLLQQVTDVGTELTRAKYGAFFYNMLDERGESYILFTLSGAPRQAFEGSACRATRRVRADLQRRGRHPLPDVLRDPRYGHEPAALRHARGPPAGAELPRGAGEVARRRRARRALLRPPEPGVFTERSERLALGVAAQAAVAIDNARLYRRATAEIDERLRAEPELRASERLYRAIGESIDYGVWICDAGGPQPLRERLLPAPGRADAGGVLELRLVRRAPPRRRRRDALAAWKDVRARRATHWDREHRFRGVDGKWHPILARGVPVRDDERGEITAWVGHQPRHQRA